MAVPHKQIGSNEVGGAGGAPEGTCEESLFLADLFTNVGGALYSILSKYSEDGECEWVFNNSKVK